MLAHSRRTSDFTESGRGTYSSSVDILSPLTKAQSKNFSVVLACAGLSCALCIMMKVAPVSGQLSLPGWSVSTWKNDFDHSALAAAALNVSSSGATKLPAWLRSKVCDILFDVA